MGQRPRGGLLPARHSVAVAALSCLGLLLTLAPAAQAAAFEQSGVFAGSAAPLSKEQIEADEEIQLGGIGGMAVNYTGNGGVPTGTVYAATGTNNFNSMWVAMYWPKPAGGLEFKEAWHVAEEAGPYGRCGPLLGTECKPRAESPAPGVDVEVDQATGNVYALGATGKAGLDAVVGFNADGSEEITRFGEIVPFVQTVAESPGKVHESPVPGGLAVNADGWVYVFDEHQIGENYHRLMVFEPETPGDYSHYKYAGEVAAGTEGHSPMLPVADAAGDVYVGGFESNYIEEYAPETPAAYPAPHATPVCSFTKGGITSITVNPLTGEPFVYSLKLSAGVKYVRQLGPCEEGKFKEIGKVQVKPERDDLFAMAFDPAQHAEPSRPKGILYGGAPGPVPSAEGTGEPGQSSLGYIFGHPKGPARKLTLTKAGTGTGTVTSSPSGIECGSLCSQEFEEGEAVTLIATPGEGSEFSGWSGECASVSGNECKVTMSAARAITAEFSPASGAPKFKLSVSKLGTGAGKVTSTPAGISCGLTCNFEFEEGKEVELKEEASPGSEFKEWTGACSGSGTCKVTMTEARSVGAVFEFKPTPEYTLTVTVSGEGEVSANAGTISGCTSSGGANCKGTYLEGAKVTLTETPGAGQQFKGWGTPQCDESTATTCLVEVKGDEGVAASFAAPKPKFKLSVTKPGAGAGKVTSTPAGIDCGLTCSFEYEEGKEVELKETPEAGSEFIEWSGACSGSGTCKVTMSAAKEVAAEFKLVPKPKFTLKVKTTGTGTGKVESTSPLSPKIVCGSECEKEFEEGTKVTLTQSANPGSKFIEWQGACTGTTTCEVTMSAAKEVTARFDLVPKFKLSVTKPGTGTGKVTSTPAGIDCGSTCGFEYEEGKEVELKESAEAGSEFVKWSGACPGTGACKVTMSAAKEVGAEFKLLPKPKFKLTVSKTGVGAGAVSGGSLAEPATIACGTGTGCEHEYEEGTLVTLSQSATAGSEFKGWSGCTSEEAGKCKVTMSSAKAVSAKFDLAPKPKFKLSVTKPGTGAGKVTSTPAGIDCGATCSFEFEEGKLVELKAAASAGSEFSEWTGACTGTGICKVTMSAARAVGAKFDLVSTFKLTVSKSGTGEGTVSSSPAGIECGATCSAEYEAGTEVELTASPEEGSEFLKWSGACTGTGPCQVTMSAAKSVTATFKVTPTYRLLVQKSGTGQGRVTSAPISDIDCGSTCEAKLPAGTEVELTATPSPGSEFFQWSGACSGQGLCKVTMDSAKTVHATFKALPSFKLSLIRTGSGTVTSSPPGISCGAECEHEYSAGTAITLTATPARGYRLKGWSGCDSASGPTCTLTMGSDRSVSASFALAKCKRGFHKGKVNGKPHCVRTRRHAHRRGARNSLALPVLWP